MSVESEAAKRIVDLKELIFGRPQTVTIDIPKDSKEADLGTFLSTSYGPPWNSMNGSGVTANGTDLRPNKQIYGVAVDPKIIPLGTKLYIWPNPFNYKGTFEAFDTGGAIKNKRIDFYDWRGRGNQMGWGLRRVRVGRTSLTSEPGKDTAGDILEAGTDVTAGAAKAANALPAFLGELGVIFTQEFWMRFGKVAIGVALVLMGVAFMAKEFSPVGQIAKVFKK